MHRKQYFCWALIPALLLGSFATAAPQQAVTVDIAPQPMEAALNELGRQVNLHVVLYSEVAKGVVSQRVSGRFTAREALDRLLKDSGLRYEYLDEKTVAVRLEESAGRQKLLKGNMQQVLQLTQTETPAVVDRETGTEEENPGARQSGEGPAEIVVTGSRLRGASGEATVQPVFTYEREDLDRLGISSIQDLRDYIPQLPPTDWNYPPGALAPADTTHIPGGTGLGEGLRGLGNTSTLVLVNGRRVPKLDQDSGADFYDLTGIPMAAVERIEVLTSGASAVYGADAMAGVINFILKKEFSGTTLSATYGNTFDTDTGLTDIQLSSHHRAGKLGLNLMAGWMKQNSLAPRDRWFTASYDRRPFGGADGRSTAPIGPGQVRSVTGENLPGLDSPVAAIPRNSDGIHLTIADFANSTLETIPYDPAQYIDGGSQSSERLGFNGEYGVGPRLRVFWDSTFTRSRGGDSADAPYALTGDVDFFKVVLPAGYVGNPFGVPILLERVLWDWQPLFDQKFYEQKNLSLLGGIDGNLRGDWRYELFAQWNRTEHAGQHFASLSGFAIRFGGVDNADPNLHPVLLNDGTANQPNSVEKMLAIANAGYGDLGALAEEDPEQWQYTAGVNGSLFSLPTGAVRMALGTEVLQDRFISSPGSLIPSGTERTSNAAYVELSIPLASERRALPGLRKLDLSLALRSDEYSDFGRKTAPHVGLLYSPHRALTLRTSYGEGYKAPALQLMHMDSWTGTQYLFGVSDPLRAGQLYNSYPVVAVGGGNPEIKPELSNNVSAGAVWEPPLPGRATVSLDYYRIRQTDRIVSLSSAQDMEMLLLHFPERVMRAEPTAEEAAAGLAGVVTGLDRRPINVARLETAGWDLELRYESPQTRWGGAWMRVAVTKPQTYNLVARPDAPVFDGASGQPWRSVATLSWRTGAWEFGTIASYTSGYRSGVTLTAAGERIPSVFYRGDDYFVSYRPEAGAGANTHGWRDALRGWQMNLRLWNIQDKEPAYDPENGQMLGSIDPRGRRFQVSLTRQF